MNKIKMILMLALLAGTGAARAQDPPAQVGRLSYVQGTVSFAPADAGSDWIAAPVNWPVTSGDRLWADRDGLAEMRIGANAIRAGALTSVDVLRLDDMGTQLRLAQGTLNIRVRQLEPTESFEVSTYRRYGIAVTARQLSPECRPGGRRHHRTGASGPG